MNSNIYLSPHFSLSEFTASATARKYGIVNEAPDEAVENLRRLCYGTLEPLRNALGLPIIITSGYRTKTLNDKLSRSSKHSQHMQGQAADFHLSQTLMSRILCISRRKQLIKAFRRIILDESIDYDQLIIYPSFIHVSYVSRSRNRHNIMLGMRNGKFSALTRDAALSLI